MTMKLRTCVSAAGRFVYGVHRPNFTADNFRETNGVADLGTFPDGSRHQNTSNFPSGPVHEPAADWIFEVPNAFPFRGTTYIGKTWADARAANPDAIGLPDTPELSFFKDHPDEQAATRTIRNLARPLQLALAATSTDARDLCCLAQMACTLWPEGDHVHPGAWPTGYPTAESKPVIADEALFDAVANNRHLPDAYKQAMVLRPGAQGGSEIVGEWRRSDPHSHAFEYLRRNSYIPWGHYAANMADDAVRYRCRTLADRTWPACATFTTSEATPGWRSFWAAVDWQTADPERKSIGIAAATNPKSIAKKHDNRFQPDPVGLELRV
jgi:hypothetical protein